MLSSAVGEHIPEHGKPGHLHAVAFSVSWVTAAHPSASELPACGQQYGGQVCYHSAYLLCCNCM